MQQPISRRDVYEPSLTATIGGRDVELSSASIDRMLPDPVVGGGLTAASGELVTVEGVDVTDRISTPWDLDSQWPPVPETQVSASMDVGAGSVSILRNGRVVSTSGGTRRREIAVEVADAYQSLDRSISWDAVADSMPSVDEAEYARYVGMQSSAVTDLILRHCGWYSTPPRLGYPMLSVPAQGTMWPERGYVTRALNYSGTAYPGWSSTPWGVAVTDPDATYDLETAYSLDSRTVIELAAMTQTAGGDGTMYLDVRSGDWSSRLRMQWTDTTALLRVASADGVFSNIVSVPRRNGLLYGSFRRISSTRIEATLRSGGEVVSSVIDVPAPVTASLLSVAQVWGEGRAGGFQVAAPSVAGTLTSWTPNAVLYVRESGRNALLVRPSVESANCADLLKAQCEAECATYWIDETGVLRWWDLSRLEATESIGTLNSDDDIAESGFTWSHSLSSVKSGVAVTWREPLRDISWRTRVDLWQGRGSSIQIGEEPREEWINVPDDEIWIMPDLDLNELTVTGNIIDFNRGTGSWFGGTYDDTDNWATTLHVTAQRVTDTAFKLRTVVAASGADLTVVQRTVSPEASSTLWRRRRDMDLPIIRGKAKFTLADRSTHAAQTGPATAPEHIIDAGWWLQHESQAKYTADYVAARVTVPQAVLSSIDLIPVPGLQLGDMVTVRDESVSGLVVRGLVVGDSRSINADMGMRHAVAVRPLQVSRNGATWEQWATAVRPDTHAGWGTRWQNKTWQSWGADPLAGEE